MLSRHMIMIQIETRASRTPRTSSSPGSVSLVGATTGTMIVASHYKLRSIYMYYVGSSFKSDMYIFARSTGRMDFFEFFGY